MYAKFVVTVVIKHGNIEIIFTAIKLNACRASCSVTQIMYQNSSFAFYCSIVMPIQCMDEFRNCIFMNGNRFGFLYMVK